MIYDIGHFSKFGRFWASLLGVAGRVLWRERSSQLGVYETYPLRTFRRRVY
jgi:hypothetical protein